MEDDETTVDREILWMIVTEFAGVVKIPRVQRTPSKSADRTISTVVFFIEGGCEIARKENQMRVMKGQRSRLDKLVRAGKGI